MEQVPPPLILTISKQLNLNSFQIPLTLRTTLIFINHFTKSTFYSLIKKMMVHMTFNHLRTQPNAS